MVIRRPRGRAGRDAVPSTTPGLTRVSSMVILGVTMNEGFSFEAHITRICFQARQSLYALRILVGHGLSGPMLCDMRQVSCYNGGPNALCCSGLVGVCRATRKEPPSVGDAASDSSAVPAREQSIV